MRHQIKLLLLNIPLMIPSAHSAVNMKDASFQRTFTDGGMITRTYSSRSLYNGLFGFGWCSNLESRLKIDKEITLIECEIVTRGPKLEKRGNYYHLKREASEETYDSEGKLIRIKTPSRKMELRPRAKPKTMIADGETWTIEYDSTETRIRKISSKERELKYQYQGEDLVNVYDNKLRLQKYAYDDLHNLTEIIGLGTEKLRYNPDQDWVVERKRQDGCLETYQYERVEHSAGPKEVARAQINCGRKTDSITYEFWYREGSKKELSLAKVRSTAGTEVTEIEIEGDI